MSNAAADARTRSSVRAVEVYRLHAMGRDTVRVRHFYHHGLFSIHKMDNRTDLGRFI